MDGARADERARRDVRARAADRVAEVRARTLAAARGGRRWGRSRQSADEHSRLRGRGAGGDMRAEANPIVIPPSAATNGDERPLSFNQSAHLALEWLAQLKSKVKPPVPMVLGLSFEGAVNAAAIEDALNEVLRRHEVLRASFLDPRRLSARQEAALTVGLVRRGIADAGVFSQRIW